MYRRVKIEHYRSIEACDVTLSPFTVVVGPNGSGKSNFADALVFMRDVATDATTAVASRGGITSVRQWSKSKPYDVSLTIELRAQKSDSKSVSHSLKIGSGNEGSWKFKSERIELHGQGTGWSVNRTGQTVSVEGSKVQFGVLPETASSMVLARQVLSMPSALRVGLLSVRRYRLNPESMRQPQVMTESGRLSESGHNVATAILRLEQSQEFERAIVEPMRRIVPGLKSISTAKAGRHLLLEFTQAHSGSTASFTASDMSEGALRALGVIVAAHQLEKHELLIVEEPEANVHAGAAGLLFDVLRHASTRGGVLITTHSPELLDAAGDEDVLVLVCESSQGTTRIGPLDVRQRELVKEGLFSVAELMRSEPLRIEGLEPRAVQD